MYDLNFPPLAGSGTASVKEWYRQLRLYGTPEQKRRFPEPNLPQVATTVPFEAQRSENFQEFLKREQAEAAAKSPQERIVGLFIAYWRDVTTLNERHKRKEIALAYAQARSTDGRVDDHVMNICLAELHDVNAVWFNNMQPALAQAIRARMHAEEQDNKCKLNF